MTDLSWTDDRVELLKKLWMDGLSASQIANELGGVTRNAVIGKVHRLGLSGRAKAPAANPRPQAAKKPAAPQRPAAAPAPTASRAPQSVGNTALKAEPAAAPQQRPQPKPVMLDLSEPPLVENCSVLQLTERTCRWPVGDPTTEQFHFCARSAGTGMPYCAYHARVAYQPVADRRRDRRVAG